MNKQAYMEETYKESFSEELQKIAEEGKGDSKTMRVMKNLTALGVGLPVGAVAGGVTGSFIGGAVGSRKAKSMTPSQIAKEVGAAKIKSKRLKKKGFTYQKTKGFVGGSPIRLFRGKDGLARIMSAKKAVIYGSRGIIPGAIVGAVALKKLLKNKDN